VFDWDDLKLLLAAHRARSLGKAAQLLGVSVSTISRRLEALEEQLGWVLFARTPDGLVPEVGVEELVAHAEAAEQAAARVEAASRAARLRASEAVRIAAPPDFAKVVLTAILPRLFAAHPSVSLELIEGVEVSDMSRRAADLAIRTTRPEQGDELVLTRLREAAFGVFVSERYLETIGPEPDPRALRWVVWSHPGAARSDHLTRHLAAGQVALRCSDPTTARMAVLHGVGAGLLPRAFARLTPWLREIEVGLPPLSPSTLWLVGHRAVIDLPAVRRVWEFLVETLRDGPTRDEDALARAIAATSGG
jgi:DNA-binding transcriptional LysR family regulator